MLAVLHVAHSRQVSEGKVERLRREPDLRLHLVRPDNRGARPPAPGPSPLDGCLLRPVWRRGDPHRCLYGTLTFGLHRVHPDLIHVEEEPDSLAALQVCLARAACARPARLVFHTWQNVARELGPGVRALLRRTLRAADAVLCASRQAEQVVRDRGFAGLTRTILPQGVDTDRFTPAGAPAPPGRFAVGYVGRLVPEKGCATAIEAVAALDLPSSLTLVGDGPERLALARRAAGLGISERVHFAGPLEHAAIPRVLASFDVVVLPSRTTAVWKEQFGRVLAEAMACGIPVVGSDSGAIPEVVGDAGRVFPEGDAVALAARLHELRSDPALRRALGRRGRERAVREFSDARLAEQTAAFYRELAAAPGGTKRAGGEPGGGP